MSTKDDKVELLDRALNGADGSSDPEVADLARLARTLSDELAFEVKPDRTTRAMFMAGVGARHHRPHWLGVLTPALAVVSLLALLFVVAARSDNGPLVGVRKALNAVGVAREPLASVTRQ